VFTCGSPLKNAISVCRLFGDFEIQWERENISLSAYRPCPLWQELCKHSLKFKCPPNQQLKGFKVKWKRKEAIVCASLHIHPYHVEIKPQLGKMLILVN
jgi:hypothetical protein